MVAWGFRQTSWKRWVLKWVLRMDSTDKADKREGISGGERSWEREGIGGGPLTSWCGGPSYLDLPHDPRPLSL